MTGVIGHHSRMVEETSGLAVPTSVKERRKARKWSQERLGQESGLSTTAVHNLETGKNGFTDKTLAGLARALECRPADLLLPMQSKTETSPEGQLRSALLAFGVDRDELDQVIRVIGTYVPADAKAEQTSTEGQSQPASPHREQAPSGKRSRQPTS